MENNGIINFSDFLKNNTKESDFNKADFNDFFLEEDESLVISESVSEVTHEENSEEESYIEEEAPKPIESNENYYVVYKDRPEDFSCDIQIEGANLNDTQARLILESDDWTLMFNGEINNKGKCTIPIKKLAILNEGVVGKIRLEIIAEGSVFTPWEDDFQVKISKKVSVKIHESKYNSKNQNGPKLIRN